MMASADSSLSHKASNTCLASLLDRVLSAMRAIRPDRRSAEIGQSAISLPSRFSRAAISPLIQLAASLP